MSGVYTIGLYDCSRRNRGADGIANLANSDMISIYRKYSEDVNSELSGNMAADFFQHLKVQRQSRGDDTTDIPEDINSFSGDVKTQVHGW